MADMPKPKKIAIMENHALKGKGFASLLSSHPKVEERIERLQKMQREMKRGFRG